MRYESFQDFLSGHDTIQAAFKAAFTSRTISKGHIIVGQGDNGRDIFWLKKGKAKAVIFSEGGHEVQLAEFSAGTLFGEMAALLDISRSSNVVANSDCHVDIISAKDFTTIMQTFPELALFMTQMLARRLQQTSQSLFESLAFTVPQRLYEDLIRRAQNSPADIETYRLEPAPFVTSLSEALNVSREAASRGVTKLVSRGLVKKYKSHWDIIRPDFGDY